MKAVKEEYEGKVHEVLSAITSNTRNYVDDEKERLLGDDGEYHDT